MQVNTERVKTADKVMYHKEGGNKKKINLLIN